MAVSVQSSAAPPDMTLFVHAICPYAHRTWLTVVERNLSPYVRVEHVGLGPTMQPWYKALNPKETVPSLFIHGDRGVKGKQTPHYRAGRDGRLLLESLDIMYHLGTLGSGPELLPARHEATVKRFIRRADDVITLLYKTLMAPPKHQPRVAKATAAALGHLDDAFAALPGCDGPFFLGAHEPCAADIAVAPFLDRFEHTLPKYALGFQPLAHCPRLAAMLTAFRRRPSFASSSMPPEYYVERYNGYTFAVLKGVDPRSKV